MSHQQMSDEHQALAQEAIARKFSEHSTNYSVGVISQELSHTHRSGVISWMSTVIVTADGTRYDVHLSRVGEKIMITDIVDDRYN
jgi:hypothetical protein